MSSGGPGGWVGGGGGKAGGGSEGEINLSSTRASRKLGLAPVRWRLGSRDGSVPLIMRQARRRASARFQRPLGPSENTPESFVNG